MESESQRSVLAGLSPPGGAGAHLRSLQKRMRLIKGATALSSAETIYRLKRGIAK